jgi:deoxyadenosine/deoxycytidine kinase
MPLNNNMLKYNNQLAIMRPNLLITVTVQKIFLKKRIAERSRG